MRLNSIIICLLFVTGCSDYSHIQATPPLTFTLVRDCSHWYQSKYVVRDEQTHRMYLSDEPPQLLDRYDEERFLTPLTEGVNLADIC